jgi:hypothetical protein
MSSKSSAPASSIVTSMIMSSSTSGQSSRPLRRWPTRRSYTNTRESGLPQRRSRLRRSRDTASLSSVMVFGIGTSAPSTPWQLKHIGRQ